MDEVVKIFNHTKCPYELQNTYIEVGELKKSGFTISDVTLVELWIASGLSEGYIRKEAQSGKRTPVYKVLTQLEQLAGIDEAYILIQSDNVSDDIMYCAQSIALLLKYSAIKNQTVILFTKYSEERLEQIINSRTFKNSKEKELYLSLFEKADAIVYERANCYENGKMLKIRSKNPEIKPILEKLMNEIHK